MVLGGFLLISLACALTAAWGVGAFSGLAWLWVVPLSFVGAFVSLLILVVLVVAIMALLVDRKKPRQEDSAFYRFVVYRLLDLILPLIRYRVHTKGMEKAPACRRVMLVCNHLHELDPAILLDQFRPYRLAFISKKENERLPVVAQFSHRLLCQSIDRENDRQALKTILKCIDLLQEDKVSIGVFPEGHCHKDGQLHPLRSGVFKIAQRAKVPIVVCTLRNTQHGVRNLLHLKPTDIHMHLVAVLEPQEFADMTATQIADRVHELMRKDLEISLDLQDA